MKNIIYTYIRQMDLPYQEDLPVHLLAGCFNNTSATYKFYWFLAVLGRVELGETKIAKRDLFAEMVAEIGLA